MKRRRKNGGKKVKGGREGNTLKLKYLLKAGSSKYKGVNMVKGEITGEEKRPTGDDLSTEEVKEETKVLMES